MPYISYDELFNDVEQKRSKCILDGQFWYTVILITFLALRGQQGISIGPITDADHGHGSVELGYDVRVCSCRVGGQTF